MIHKSFTLIEILVVVFIIALITSIIILSFGYPRQTSRDSERNSDLNKVAAALGNYYLDNSKYPLPNSGALLNPGENESNIATSKSDYIYLLGVLTGTPKYLDKCVRDPNDQVAISDCTSLQNPTNPNFGYRYVCWKNSPTGADCQSYLLVGATELEKGANILSGGLSTEKEFAICNGKTTGQTQCGVQLVGGTTPTPTITVTNNPGPAIAYLFWKDDAENYQNLGRFLHTTIDQWAAGTTRGIMWDTDSRNSRYDTSFSCLKYCATPKTGTGELCGCGENNPEQFYADVLRNRAEIRVCTDQSCSGSSYIGTVHLFQNGVDKGKFATSSIDATSMWVVVPDPMGGPPYQSCDFQTKSYYIVSTNYYVHETISLPNTSDHAQDDLIAKFNSDILALKVVDNAGGDKGELKIFQKSGTTYNDLGKYRETSGGAQGRCKSALTTNWNQVNVRWATDTNRGGSNDSPFDETCLDLTCEINRWLTNTGIYVGLSL
ncbi:MAG: putative General secretion pathway protein GspG [Candidatus Berkelbacteria bacterium]|nr:putative General secretion pathway protein GspG [Candidatus Berkelbacteria bacterium]